MIPIEIINARIPDLTINVGWFSKVNKPHPLIIKIRAPIKYDAVNACKRVSAIFFKSSSASFLFSLININMQPAVEATDTDRANNYHIGDECNDIHHIVDIIIRLLP